MLAYNARGPRGENLRLVCFHVKAHPDLTQMKVVVQVIENGQPIVEDPIAEEFMTLAEIEEYVEESRRQGWAIKKLKPVANKTAPKRGRSV